MRSDSGCPHRRRPARAAIIDTGMNRGEPGADGTKTPELDTAVIYVTVSDVER
jgi:hypothetical protein